jgi:cytochrome c-type biogenesis protein CcmH
MMRRCFAIVAFALAIFANVPTSLAVQPDEMLSDPVLEQRARNISAELRCLVCQNQSIDDSDAPLAADLRRLVRERLVAHDTDQQVLDYLVARYGEFVLLKPRFELSTVLLWLTPALVFLVGLTVAARAVARQPAAEAKPLSEQEKAQIAKIMADGGP